MSQETAYWLNRNVLIGFTEQRGRAWHYRAAYQGMEPNHYPGPIPVADVERRLFYWDAVPGEVLIRSRRHGVRRSARTPLAVVASDTGEDLGIHTDIYEIHQFREWLLEKVASILDGGLAVGSAGLLKNRAQAWVSVEVPDTVHTPHGVAFRPHLLACTSHDGSLKTTYKRTVVNVVCDNTMGAALSGSGQVIKIPHRKNSRLTVLSARQALDMVAVLADEFTDQIRTLCEIDVSDKAWAQFVQAHVPEKDTKRGKINAAAKRAELHRLWTSDSRVSPWKGTAWGVVQAVNTYEHHHAAIRGASRAERNLSRAVTDHADRLDTATLTQLDKVLAAA
jgi:phage/plasmid-like protein (TIGR03299 family)